MTNSLISGSGALWCLHPGSFVPGDLNIYVPENRSTLFEEFVVGISGYEKLQPGNTTKDLKALYPSPSEFGTNDIKTVMWFKKVDKIMNIVVVAGKNALLPIFHFHATFAMNFISCYGLFSTYPKLTMARWGILNLPYQQMPVKVQGWVEKYERRSMECGLTLQAWQEFDNHVCAVNGSCPATPRTLYDRHGLFIPFSTHLLLSPETSANRNVIYTHVCSIVWQLKYSCSTHGRWPHQNGYVHSTTLHV